MVYTAPNSKKQSCDQQFVTVELLVWILKPKPNRIFLGVVSFKILLEFLQTDKK